MIENVARANPIVLTYMPFIELVIKPNIANWLEITKKNNDTGGYGV